LSEEIEQFTGKLLSKLRVLIIAQYFPPDMGGSATRAYNVAKGLMLNNCKVTVITAFPHYPHGDTPKEYRYKAFVVENSEGFKVIRTFVPPVASHGLVKRAFIFLSFIISSLFAFPLIGRIDIVWSANPNILSMLPAIAYSKLKKCPVALNVDDLWPEFLYLPSIKENSLLVRIARFMAKFVYLAASVITPISPGYVKVICEKYGVSRDKVHVVRAGVDLNKFTIAADMFKNGEKTFRVLYSGAFSVAYDFDQILLAAKALKGLDGVEFVLQGGGELVEYVKSKVKELNLANVSVIDKIVSREEVAKLLVQTDALILPLRDFGTPYLGLSSKLYEYQAAGKPIICCADGQPAEYVKETKSGVVVHPGDYEALAKAVVYLRDNLDVVRSLGVSGRQYVKDNVSIERIGFEMKRVFEKVKGEC